MAERVLEKLRREIEETGFKLSIAEGGKEGKSNVFASCRDLEERFQECSEQEGAVMATSVETSGLDLCSRTEQLGATEMARRKSAR